MSALAISYPVADARQGIERYPAIRKAFTLPDSSHSRFEIVRLLSNTHCDSICRLLEFIDRWLDVSGPIGRKVLKTKHPFQLEQTVAELDMFANLHERLGTTVQAAESGDVEVRFDAWTVRIEVYTPVDLLGFQLFRRYVPMVLKYLDVWCGYDLDVRIQPFEDVPDYGRDGAYYAYSIPDENETYQWLAEFAEAVRQWLGKASPNQELRMRGPGGKVDLVVKLTELNEDPGNRRICLLCGTRSNDSRLFFEVGNAQYTAGSSWGRKLKNKLKDRQCGDAAEDILRMLVVNFAMADTGWPEFISEERFGKGPSPPPRRVGSARGLTLRMD